MGEQTFQVLGVLSGSLTAAAAGQAEGDGHGTLLAEPVVHLGSLVDQRVHTIGNEVSKLDLSDGTQAGDGGADTGAHIAGLGGGAVNDAVGAKGGLQTQGNAHGTGGNIQAEHKDLVVLCHGLVHSLIQAFYHS